MIQANELRIGNYVNCTYIVEEHNEEKDEWSDIAHTVIGKVTAIDSVNLTDHKIWVETTDCIEYFEEIEPIQITEDILLRCGFEKETSHISEDHPWADYVKNDVVISLPYFEFNFESTTLEVRHLHQLQNLYFSLTGEELKFEL